MSDVPSWRLKIDRAAQHLEELKAILPTGLSTPHRFTVAEDGDDETGWTYRLSTPFTIDPFTPVILGDFLFNIRSALDHMAVALSSRPDDKRIQFPIFDREPGNAEERARWRDQTQGIAQEPLRLIQQVQPYTARQRTGGRPTLGPEHQALSILSRLQNADKHRRLLVATQGLAISSLTARDAITGEDLGWEVLDIPQRVVPNGNSIGPTETRAHVSADGTAPVYILDGQQEEPRFRVPGEGSKKARRAYALIPTCQTLLYFATSDVLIPLEQHLPADD